MAGLQTDGLNCSDCLPAPFGDRFLYNGQREISSWRLGSEGLRNKTEERECGALQNVQAYETRAVSILTNELYPRTIRPICRE